MAWNGVKTTVAPLSSTTLRLPSASLTISLKFSVMSMDCPVTYVPFGEVLVIEVMVAVVGLIYVFFFETLVANLPGSLKQLSLNYYVRSLLYNEATSEVTTVAPDTLDVYAPTDPTTAWVTVLLATIGLTLLGMWLFGSQEPKDET